jgi:hypothetical protein
MPPQSDSQRTRRPVDRAIETDDPWAGDDAAWTQQEASEDDFDVVAFGRALFVFVVASVPIWAAIALALRALL